MSHRILKFKDVHARVGKSRATLWRWERDDAFPRRLRTGQNSIGWLECEIDEWVLIKIKERSFRSSILKKRLSALTAPTARLCLQ